MAGSAESTSAVPPPGALTQEDSGASGDKAGGRQVSEQMRAAKLRAAAAARSSVLPAKAEDAILPLPPSSECVRPYQHGVRSGGAVGIP
jgi:hypothetical protein